MLTRPWLSFDTIRMFTMNTIPSDEPNELLQMTSTLSETRTGSIFISLWLKKRQRPKQRSVSFQVFVKRRMSRHSRNSLEFRKAIIVQYPAVVRVSLKHHDHGNLSSNAAMGVLWKSRGRAARFSAKNSSAFYGLRRRETIKRCLALIFDSSTLSCQFPRKPRLEGLNQSGTRRNIQTQTDRCGGTYFISERLNHRSPWLRLRVLSFSKELVRKHEARASSGLKQFVLCERFSTKRQSEICCRERQVQQLETISTAR